MKKITTLILSLAVLVARSQTPATAPAATTRMIDKVEANGNPLIIGYEKWKLPNGLTVIFHEDHSDPIVHVRVSYHVGSARESISKSGFAHFFEHMMFQGSEHVKDEEHFKVVSESGGTMNGFTERDMTTYFETMPSNQLEVALWLESDRMGFLLDSLTSKKFENQRETVKNEKSQNVENQQYAMAFVEYINQILYPSGHPYSWPVIGYVDDLNRASLQDVKNFFLRWYGPNNAVLTLAGDFNPKDVLPMVEKYFGNIQPSPEVKKMKVPAAILSSDQYFNYTDNVYLPLTLMVYPTVPDYHRDEAALDLLSQMLGEGNNSPMYKSFVKTEKAIEASCSHQASELAGEFQVVVVSFPPEDPANIGKTFNEAEKQLHNTIDSFGITGITDEALQRAKAKTENMLTENMTSVFGKAGLLAEWDIMLGKPYNLTDEIERYNKVTKEDISRVYLKYIKGKNAAIVNVYPKNPESKDSVKSVNPYAGMSSTNEAEYAGLKYVKAKDSFSRATKPASGQPKLVNVPQFYTSKLKNGMNIIGTQNNETPIVVMLLEMEGGRSVFTADPKKGDVATLTADMMNEATTKHTTEQISSDLDKLGSTIQFGVDKFHTTVYIQTLTKNIDATLAILEEKLTSPKFSAEDFKRVKKAECEAQTNQKTNADASAGKMFGSLVYGATSMGAYSSYKSMNSVTLDEVKSYYNTYYSPSVAKLIIVGDVKETDIASKFAFLEKWPAKEVKIPAIGSFPSAEPTQIYLIHKERAAQSVIVMGHLGLPYDATGNYFKANAMNYSLGGSFNSRINLNLREDKGWTYGSRSFFNGTKVQGPFIVSASVKTNATDSAIVEINKELTRFLKDGITPEELTFTKSSLLNSDALKYETPDDKARFLERIAEYNLSKDFPSQQNAMMKTYTKEDIDKAAREFIHPDKMVIVVVGNKWLIKKPLENLGLGKVKEVSLD